MPGRETEGRREGSRGRGGASREAKEGRAAEIPRAVLERLSLYLRRLEAAGREGRGTISSAELGRALGLGSAQVRKDLASLGPLGARGVGYRVATLARALKAVLGTDRAWKMALVGLGHLGSALVRHKQFQDQGFRFAAIFDASPDLVGREVEGLRVRPVQELERAIQREGIRLAMVAVPAHAAPAVAGRLVAAGVKGILNFTSAALSVPRDVAVVNVDLALHLERLTSHLARSLVAEEGRARLGTPGRPSA